MRVDAENEVVIARPPREVFAYLADAENDRAWRPAVLDIERVSGHGAGTPTARASRARAGGGSMPTSRRRPTSPTG